jgi:hypothetical protein
MNYQHAGTDEWGYMVPNELEGDMNNVPFFYHNGSLIVGHPYEEHYDIADRLNPDLANVYENNFPTGVAGRAYLNHPYFWLYQGSDHPLTDEVAQALTDHFSKEHNGSHQKEARFYRYVYKNGEAIVEPGADAYHYDLWQRMGLPDNQRDSWSAGYYDADEDSWTENDGSYQPELMAHPDDVYHAIIQNLPKEHQASDTYTGDPAEIIHVPTGDDGEPYGRVPGIYDSYNNKFYHGDRGGSHYELVNHLYQPQTDDDYLDDTVDYGTYLGEHHIPTIYFPENSGYLGGQLLWAERIKPALKQQFIDAMERHVSENHDSSVHAGRSNGGAVWHEYECQAANYFIDLM